MNETENDYLTKFYFLLRDNLKREKSLRENSVLLSFLRIQSASKYRLLRKSTLSSVFIPSQIMTALLAKGHIQCIENIDNYAITAKGVWHYEHNIDLINEENLLSYINDNFFIPKVRSDLNDKQKVILFMMISARSFSQRSSVDLKRSDVAKNKWQEMLEKSYDVLYDLGSIVKLKKENFLGQRGNVHVVSSIFRHNNQMVQKTRGIYSYNRKQEYYLDLHKNSTFSQDKLSYLFWKVFQGDISSASANDIISYCNEISRRESIYLFDMPEHIFSMPTYDVIIKDALMDSIILKDRWAKIS